MVSDVNGLDPGQIRLFSVFGFVSPHYRGQQLHQDHTYHPIVHCGQLRRFIFTHGPDLFWMVDMNVPELAGFLPNIYQKKNSSAIGGECVGMFSSYMVNWR
jgi:hypothetical protein